MAYVKQNFVDGNVLNASELNHMEDGIGDAYVKPSGGIPASDIADGAVTAVKIASNAVSAVYTATIGTSWSSTGGSAPYTKTVSIAGILATDSPIVDLQASSTYADAEQQISAWASVYRVNATANTLTFYATDEPTVALPIKVRCIRK